MTEANRYPGDDGVVPPGSGAEQGSGDDSDRDAGDLDKGEGSGDEKPDKEESGFLGDVDDEGEFVSAGEKEEKEGEGAVPPGFQMERGFGPPIGEKEAGVSAEEPAGEVPPAVVEPAEGAAVQGELFTTEPAASVEAEGVPSLAEAEKWAAEHPAAAEAVPEPEAVFEPAAVVEEPEPVAPKPAVKKAPKKKAKKAKKKAAKKAKKKPKKKAKKKKAAKKKKKGKKR